jgi:hypothetical protein
MRVALLASIGAAVVSGMFAYRSTRAAERLRQSHERHSRLEVATGALQLELFLETRSFARRLVHYFRESGDDHELATVRRGANAGAYHAGGMTVYRILRPLTVGEIIEKQTLAGDLILDPVMLEMLRFSQGAVEMLTGDKVGASWSAGDGSEPEFDMKSCWNLDSEGSGEFQRIRGSYLRCGAAALLAEPVVGEEPRCITHAEFCKLWERPEMGSERAHEFHQALEPIKRSLDGFNRHQNPIFWLRLVGYAYTCESFYDRMSETMAGRRALRRARGVLAGRKPVEYGTIGVPVAEMLRDVGGDSDLNKYVSDYANDYVDRFGQIIDRAL